jgi:hydroxymethylglutaryl-CoA reductase (NADPH)
VPDVDAVVARLRFAIPHTDVPEAAMTTTAPRIPREKDDDYTADVAERRREFLREQTGAGLEHVGQSSFDPGVLAGNIENYVGVAQVPIGVSECGGVKTTVVDDQMQRAPAFIFSDALQAREFGEWMDVHCDEIRAAAEATTRSGKLTYIGHYQVGPLRYLRVNYTTGDAAGQNMTGKATLAACEWIKENYPGNAEYVLSGAIDTDKKHSQINMLLTRGKRVVAEAVIKNDVLQRLMGVDTKTLYDYRQIGMAGGFLAGSSYNGAHAANGLTGIFVATGQDAANISESHSGITYARLHDNGDYY